MPAIARPFHDVRIFSSRPGQMRALRFGSRMLARFGQAPPHFARVDAELGRDFLLRSGRRAGAS